jgi:hypothetical protein
MGYKWIPTKKQQLFVACFIVVYAKWK